MTGDGGSVRGILRAAAVILTGAALLYAVIFVMGAPA